MTLQAAPTGFSKVAAPKVTATSHHSYVVYRGAKAGSLWYFVFTVTGMHQFPMDMLRWDECFPRTAEDGSLILDTFDSPVERKTRFIQLRACHPVGWLPTFDRWRSLGWTVTSTVHEQG